MKMEQSVPKRRHIKFRRCGITQKKAYNIQNMVKFEIKNVVWGFHNTVDDYSLLGYGTVLISSALLTLPQELSASIFSVF
jgi:hypothetical protein